MNKLHSLRQSENGVVLITIILIGMILTFVGLSLADLAISQHRQTESKVFDANAQLVAEAGIERSVYALNQDNAFAGYATEQEFFNNASQGKGTYQTVVSTGSGNEKLITSTGKVYGLKAKSSTVVSKRKVRVSVVGTTSAGYSVYSGPGGVILSGSASITNSEVYIGGNVTMTGASTIGTNSKPLNVFIANNRCPLGTNPGATYPTVCGSGQQPITASGSPKIYGTVCATGQTTTTYISKGSTGQGLVAGCVAPIVQMPQYDRAAHIGKMTTTSVGTNNTYVCNNWPFTRSWPANLKLTGNVTVGNSCDVTIHGDAYITGDFTLSGAARIKVAEGLTTPPVIVVDGKIDAGGSGALLANSSGVGFRFISYKGCTTSCTALTGTALYTAANTETVKISGAAVAAGMIFQAYWGQATVAGSGTIGSVIGQKIDLSGAGTIVFGTGLSSGTSTWTIRSYQQLYN